MRKILYILFALSINQSFAQINLSNGLVAYYPFNGNTNDASGNGNDGIPFNVTPTTDHFGNANHAYSFDGISSFIRVLNSNSLQLGNHITIAAYVKVMGFYKGTCHDNSIYVKGDNDNVAGLSVLRFDDGQYTNFNQCNNVNVDSAHENFYGQGTFQSPGYTPYISKGVWYSLVYTYDGSAGRLYIDGVLKSGTTYSVTNFNNTYDVFFGKTNNPSFPYYFNGALDEVRIYNRVITSDETVALQNYSPLAVNIASFNVEALHNKDAQLVWKTENESGIDRYEIERSEGNNDFIKIGSVASANLVNNTYSFIDPNVYANTAYRYKLKTILKGNEFSYSSIKSFRLNTSDYIFSIYPNPSHSVIAVQLKGYTGNASVTLNSLIGQTIYSSNVNFDSNNTNQIDISKFPKGIYILKVKTSNNSYIQKVELQ